jgi:hypothetical protein
MYPSTTADFITVYDKRWWSQQRQPLPRCDQMNTTTYLLPTMCTVAHNDGHPKLHGGLVTREMSQNKK